MLSGEESVGGRKTGRNLPSGGEVQVLVLCKAFIFSELPSMNMAGELHLYQWPGTVPRSYAPRQWRSPWDPFGLRPACHDTSLALLSSSR